MKGKSIIAITFIGVFLIGFYVSANHSASQKNKISRVNDTVKKDEISTNEELKLGAFSVSLNVKDLSKSILFYENLGFSQFAGDVAMNYVILKNGTTVIGLFQGMFEGNILTFNPGWNQSAQELESYKDVREVQSILKERGVDVGIEIDKNTSGPASFIISDPDGNTIFLDQHL